MYPMYKYVEDFSLHHDDIEGIQYLYGIYPIKQSIIYWFLGLLCIFLFKIQDFWCWNPTFFYNSGLNSYII